MFRTYNGPHGWHMDFQNGWTASVSLTNKAARETAEFWSWKGDVDWTRDPDRGLSTDEVARMLAEVASRCHCGCPDEKQVSDHCAWCGCEEYERTCDQVFTWLGPDA